MKKVLIILLLMAGFVNSDGAYAQRWLPGTQGLEVRCGVADGLYSKKNESSYYLGVAMTKYAKSDNKLVFGGECLLWFHLYKAGRISITQFAGEAGYYRQFLLNSRENCFFSIGASAMAEMKLINCDCCNEEKIAKE